MLYPESDRWYLGVIELVEYHIDAIKMSLRLGTDDPSPAGFKTAVPHAKHLAKLLDLAAINYERKMEVPSD